MTQPSIHPTAIVEDGATLGEDVEIGPFCIVGEKATLGDRVRLISHVTIAGRTTLGADCVIYPGTHLGHPPQDFKFQGEDTELVLGERNILRENVTMHPGTAFARRKTVIGNDGYFMVGTHVAHDCIVGDRVVFANGAMIGGATVVEDHVILGALAGVHQNSRIGRHAFIGGLAKVVNDIIPYASVIGHPAHLAGLNLVGLKRRGMPRDTVRDLRAAYRLLFAEEGTFEERVEDVARLHKENEPVTQIIDFIRADARRSICMPYE